MKKKYNYLLALLAGFLIIAFTPTAGALFEKIIGREISSGFWGPSHPEYIEGFFMSYAFFVALFVFLFGGKNKQKTGLWLLGALLFLDGFFGDWEGLIIDVGAILTGFLLAKTIIFLKHKLQE